MVRDRGLVSGWVVPYYATMAQRRLESAITRDIIKLLKRVPRSFVRKIHGGRMQSNGLPDVYFTCAALKGRSVWIEVKQPGKKMTDMQLHVSSELEEAGAFALLAWSAEGVAVWLKDHEIEVQ